MVKGLDLFRAYFEDFQDRYILIGGVACDLNMEDLGLTFRATKDFDIVLCAEALDSAFIERFWEFVRAGEYRHQEKSTGDKQFYRFEKPGVPEFPAMLELFSRVPDQLTVPENCQLTPIPADGELSSLSAILLDDDYYQCIHNGKVVIEGLSLLSIDYILPFKAKAWLDLSQRAETGEKIDSKKIKKHRNDVFRLYPSLSPEQRIDIADSIKRDMRAFLKAMPAQEGLNLKDFGIQNRSLGEVIGDLITIYQLES